MKDLILNLVREYNKNTTRKICKDKFIKIIMKKKLIEIPTELFEKIQELAKENERSDNKQIVYLLKKALEEK